MQVSCCIECTYMKEKVVKSIVCRSVNPVAKLRSLGRVIVLCSREKIEVFLLFMFAEEH